MTTRLDKPLLLLDLGGVLADLGRPATAMGLNVGEEEFWRIWLGSPDVEAFERGGISTAEFCERMAGVLGAAGGADFESMFRRWKLRIYPGIAGHLKKLVTDYGLALLSNTSEVHWEQVRQEDGVFAGFAKCFLSFETGRFKPEEAAFRQVLEHFGCAPADVTYLDDSAKNVAAARQLEFDAHCVAGPDGLASWVRDGRR